MFVQSNLIRIFEMRNLTNQRKQINFNDNYNTPPCVWFINLCRLVGFRNFPHHWRYFSCNDLKFI